MNKQISYFLYTLIFAGCILMFAGCCKDEEENPLITAPVVATSSVDNITASSAECTANITEDGGSTVIERGICWSTGIDPTLSSNKTTFGDGAGIFTVTLPDLTENTKYYVRAYATNSAGTGYGSTYSFTTEQIAIGDAYQGGIVFHITQPSEAGYDAAKTHGLIAATSDLSNGIQWYNGSNVLTNATSLSGKTNTETIVNAQGSGSYAAKLCYDLELSGYDDWFLPSISELGMLYDYKYLVGGIVDWYYWSSTEHNDSYAYMIDFTDGQETMNFKSMNIYNVRAVRAF